MTFLFETAKTVVFSLKTLPSSIFSPLALFKYHSPKSKYSFKLILLRACVFISLHFEPLSTTKLSGKITSTPSSPLTVIVMLSLFETAKTVVFSLNSVSSFIASPSLLFKCHSLISKNSFGVATVIT